MFYVHTESGNKARVGNGFVLAGIKYPGSLVTPELLDSLGFSIITPVEIEPSNTFYDTQGINVDGNATANVFINAWPIPSLNKTSL